MFCFLFVSSISFSQDLRFGFTVTPTFGFASVEPSNDSQLDGISYTEDTESKTGFAYGILLDYDFNGEDRYFLHSGLTLHHTGFDMVYETQSGTVNSEINVDYLEIPVTLKLKTKDIGYLRYYGQFGLNNGFKVGDKVKSGNQPDFEDISTINVGLNMGGGIEYTISDETDAVAGLYYNNGFSNVADNSAGTVKQSQLGIRLGVYF